MMSAPRLAPRRLPRLPSTPSSTTSHTPNFSSASDPSSSLPRRRFATTARRPADFTHAVIGAGAIGLAISRRLAAVPNSSTLLLERHRHPGTETSSRNSEVIHAGLYYGPDSLKTELCLRGKRALYELCERRGIPHKRCGKWIVAQDDEQRDAVDKVHRFARSLGEGAAPTRWLSADEARRREPDVRAAAGALESSSTGILDSHTYMQVLLADFEERGGTAAFGSGVARVEAVDGGCGGWKIWTSGGEDEPVTAEVLVNSAGLAAIPLSNAILPPGRRRDPFYAKGTYYSYSSQRPKPRVLVYPAPRPGHGGLGTHLTVDMAGQVRFGPDVQWTDDPTDLRPNSAGFEAALEDIRTYLPGLERGAVALDYCGVRPKLSAGGSATAGGGSGGGGGSNKGSFQDFYIAKEPGFEGFVNLLGMESPGLTSSLAIGEHVHGLLYR